MPIPSIDRPYCVCSPNRDNEGHEAMAACAGPLRYGPRTSSLSPVCAKRWPHVQDPVEREWPRTENEIKATISQEEGCTDMTLRKHALLLVGMVSALFAAGCDLEKGARDGLNDGLSAAIATLIETPVDYMLDQVFAQQ